jgi:hypothetical protein
MDEVLLHVGIDNFDKASVRKTVPNSYMVHWPMRKTTFFFLSGQWGQGVGQGRLERWCWRQGRRPPGWRLALPGPLLPLLIVLTHVLALPGPLLPLLVVLTHDVALPGSLLPLLVVQCLLIAPNFLLHCPLLPLLVLLTRACTAKSSLATAFCTVFADCSKRRVTGSARLCA